MEHTIDTVADPPYWMATPSKSSLGESERLGPCHPTRPALYGRSPIRQEAGG
jgi:hypothetical protein